jgi:methylated-DNA-[protein]-cysteine S-methyltransferase
MVNMPTLGTVTVDTPVGRVVIAATEEAVVTLDWLERRGPALPHEARPSSPAARSLAAEAGRQLSAYFEKRLARFDLPLRPAGTPFQCAVYDEMSRIPFGETLTYGAIAAATGSIARAVGGTCGSNPIPLIIPCHRVVAGGGALGGFSGFGGRHTKAFLLAHESPQGSLL